MRRSALALLLVGSVFSGGLVAGAAVARGAHAKGRDPYAGLETLARALHTIESRHVEAAEPEAMVRGAIRGMADALDAHSTYMDPEDRAAFQDHAEGQATGIGIQLGLAAGDVRVLEVLPGGPADLAGVLPGDQVTAIDGTPTADPKEAAVRLLGPRDSTVALDLARDGEHVKLTIVRDTLLERSVRGELLGEGVALVRLDVFRRRSGDELVDQLASLASENRGPLSGVILDLRDNPGGLLDEAVTAVDCFVSEGMIVETRGRDGVVVESHSATDAPSDIDAPVVVLVDGGSASAAEIVAGALQATGRADLVGSPTYGKGSVQQIFLFEDGAGLKLTVARYVLPGGRMIPDGEGLVPDVVASSGAVLSPEASALRAQLVDALPDDQQAAILAAYDALPLPTSPRVARSRTAPLKARLAADPPLEAAWRRVRAAR